MCRRRNSRYVENFRSYFGISAKERVRAVFSFAEGWCGEVEDLAVRVAVLEERVDKQEEDFAKHAQKQNGSMDKIWAELSAIRQDLNGRPTWGVALVLGALSSAVVGLATYLVTKGG